jgi:hypothetical protein
LPRRHCLFEGSQYRRSATTTSPWTLRVIRRSSSSPERTAAAQPDGLATGGCRHCRPAPPASVPWLSLLQLALARDQPHHVPPGFGRITTGHRPPRAATGLIRRSRMSWCSLRSSTTSTVRRPSAPESVRAGGVHQQCPRALYPRPCREQSEQCSAAACQRVPSHRRATACDGARACGRMVACAAPSSSHCEQPVPSPDPSINPLTTPPGALYLHARQSTSVARHSPGPIFGAACSSKTATPCTAREHSARQTTFWMRRRWRGPTPKAPTPRPATARGGGPRPGRRVRKRSPAIVC